MKTLLHLTPEGDQFWRKTRGEWLPVDRPESGSVWVVSDLAEETLTEIQVPRLYGRDRSGFINRQLATRFPDTPYKVALPPLAQSGLLDRLAPPRQTLLALDAKARIDQVLDSLQGKLAGLWSTSGLLARLGVSGGMPRSLFIVVPGAQSLRILFLNKGAPTVSRLIRESTTRQSIATEIIRTLRHLENTKVIDREGDKPPVLLLGDSEGMGPALLAERMTLVDAPKALRKAAGSDFKFALFDFALRSPPGQLAPLSRRTQHLATGLNKLSFAMAIAAMGVALWLVVGSFDQARNDRAAMARSQASLTELRAKVAAVEKAVSAYPVSSDLVRGVLRLEKEELRSAPTMPGQLALVSQALSAAPGLRLANLDWALQSPGTPPCPSDEAAAPAVAPAPVAAASEAVGGVAGTRVSFDVLLPPALTSKARVGVIAGLSERLSAIPGVTLVQNPAKVKSEPALAGGSRPKDEGPISVSWCMTIANAALPRANGVTNKP